MTKLTKLRWLKLYLNNDGEKDDIVPFSMGKELYEKANDPNYFYFSADDDHMMEFNPKLLSEIKNFIEKY